jgi:predicted dienelactone hydrolase
MIAFAFALLACTAPTDTAAPEPPPWVPPDQWGPYGVGVLTLEFTDVRGKELTAEVWYPAMVEEGAEPDPYPEILLALDAHREAPPDARGAPYPLAAFSHGFSAIRYQSAFLTEWLASHGYVVVAPDHPDNTLLDLDEDLTWKVLLERPDDVRFALDQVIAEAAAGHALLAGMAEEGDYAALGHSFGAVTAMVLGGGEPVWEGVATYCLEHDSFVCDYVADESTEGHGTVDPRAVVTVPLAPGVWYAFGEGGANLAGVRAPLVLGGDRDQVLDYATEIRPCWEAMAAPKRLGTLADAGHYAFSDICALAPFIADDCDEEAGGWIDMELAHAITRTLVTAHLDLTLRGIAEAAPFLGPGWPEVTWEEE